MSAVATLPGLDPVAGECLTHVAVVVATRRPDAVEPATVLSDRAKVEDLLGLMKQVPGLRLAAARAASSPLVTTHQLLSVDDEVHAHSAAQLRRALDDGRRTARQARRASRAATKPTADAKATERTRRRTEELRTSRDQQATLREHAENVNRQLREQVAEAQEDLAQTQAQLEAALARVDAAANPGMPSLASRLAAAIAPRARRGRVADVGDRAGRADLVDPGRGTRDPNPLEPANLTRLARAAGVGPDDAGRVLDWLPRLLGYLANPPREHLVTTDLAMRVDVLGAYDEVAGSAVLVTAGDTRILVDAGTRAGANGGGPKRIGEALAARLDAVVVTHAHNDHAGWVPAVVAAQPDVPVLTTDGTAALMQTMLADSAKVMNRQARERAINGLEGTVPYGPAEVRAALKATQVLDYNQIRTVGDLDVELYPAGHILGAAGVVIGSGDHRVVVTGDVSGPGQLTVGGWDLPEAARKAGLLVMESTYGAQDVTPRHKSVSDFIRTVTSVVERGGRVLVPSFAVGRAQEVAMLLSQHLPEVTVLIDGLARDVTDVYDGRPGPDGSPLKVLGGNVHKVPPGSTRESISRLQAGVVIATSGMMNAGPAVSWARHILPDPDSALLVVGYQDPTSPGRRLQDLSGTGGGTFMLPSSAGAPSMSVAVNATVDTFGLGAHASAPELATLAAQAAADRVMLVHGDERAQRALASRLRARGQRTVHNDQAFILS